MNRLDKQYSKLVVDKVVAASYIDGVLPFIKKLNREKKPCFIISGTPQKEICHILRHKNIRSLFKDAVGSPKNKTENLKTLLVKYKINPQDALFLGDAKRDWETALKFKIDFVSMINKKSREFLSFPHLCRVSDFTGFM